MQAGVWSPDVEGLVVRCLQQLGERGRKVAHSASLSRVHPLLLLLVGFPNKGTPSILIRRPAGNLGSPLHAAARMRSASRPLHSSGAGLGGSLLERSEPGLASPHQATSQAPAENAAWGSILQLTAGS